MVDGSRDMHGAEMTQPLDVTFDPLHLHLFQAWPSLPAVYWAPAAQAWSSLLESHISSILTRVHMPGNPWCVRNSDDKIPQCNNRVHLQRAKETKQFKSHLNHFPFCIVILACSVSPIWILRASSFSHNGGLVLEMSFHLISSTS